jgi:hypothetical protein
VVPGFAMPVRVTLAGRPYRWLHPTEQWQTLRAWLAPGGALLVDPEFYVWSREVSAVAATSTR